MKVLSLGMDDVEEIVRIHAEKVEDITGDGNVKSLKAQAEKLLARINDYEEFLNNGGAGDTLRCQLARKRIRLAASDIGPLLKNQD
ncbi:MAG: hypothetical protein WC420_03655 [Candidatus Paceibacterota bacterium]|jgi:hypothetical protein